LENENECRSFWCYVWSFLESNEQDTNFYMSLMDIGAIWSIGKWMSSFWCYVWSFLESNEQDTNFYYEFDVALSVRCYELVYWIKWTDSHFYCEQLMGILGESDFEKSMYGESL